MSDKSGPVSCRSSYCYSAGRCRAFLLCFCLAVVVVVVVVFLIDACLYLADYYILMLLLLMMMRGRNATQCATQHNNNLKNKEQEKKGRKRREKQQKKKGLRFDGADAERWTQAFGGRKSLCSQLFVLKQHNKQSKINTSCKFNEAKRNEQDKRTKTFKC